MNRNVGGREGLAGHCEIAAPYHEHQQTHCADDVINDVFVEIPPYQSLYAVRNVADLITYIIMDDQRKLKLSVKNIRK